MEWGVAWTVMKMVHWLEKKDEAVSRKSALGYGKYADQLLKVSDKSMRT